MAIIDRQRHDNGFTLIELLIVVAIIGILAATAIPGLMRSRQSANEASAIASMRVINSAQSAFAASCGSGFYAGSLEFLSAQPAGGGAAYISPDLATNGVVKSGYAITLAGSAAVAPADCNANDVTSGYHATATPMAGAGQRAFGTNTTGTIFFLVGAVAPVVTDTSTDVGTPLK